MCIKRCPRMESMLPCPPISPIHTEHLDIKVSTSKALAGWSMRSSTTCKHRDQGSQESEVEKHYMQWGVPVRSRYKVPPDEKWWVRYHLATQTRTYHGVMIRIRVEQPVERNDIMFQPLFTCKLRVNQRQTWRWSSVFSSIWVQWIYIDFPHVIRYLWGSYKTFQPGYGIGEIPGSMHPLAVASDGDFWILMP